MTWLKDYYILQIQAKLIDKSIILTTKDAKIWKIIATILHIVTFGGMKKKTFLTKYATTIGPIQAYPREFTKESVRRLLYHEGYHTIQARKYGLGNPWLGLPVMAILYLFVPLPLGFAYYRFKLEMEAEAFSFRNYLKEIDLDRDCDHIKLLDRKNQFREFTARLCSGKYGWSMPLYSSMRKCEKIMKEIIKNEN